MKKDKPTHQKIFILDSNVLMRQMISNILRKMKSASINYSFSTTDSKKVLDNIGKVKPDLIFLGLDHTISKEMRLLKVIRDAVPAIPVVLLTPLNQEGASAALEGLKLGAVDYITKPGKSLSPILSAVHFQKRVVPIVQNLSELNRELLSSMEPVRESMHEVTKVSDQKSGQFSGSIDLVVIAGCTGGVHALFRLISGLPDEMPVPVIIIQHMPKIYTSELAKQLDKITAMNVREAQKDSPLIPGQIYLAPGGYHTVVKNTGNRRIISIHRGPREHKSRPSIDVLLRSTAHTCNQRVLGVFLSGAGSDGMKGARYILEAGGKIILQDKVSSLLWKLPQYISDLKPSLSKFPADKLGREIMNVIEKPRVKKFSGHRAESESHWNWDAG